MFRLTKRRKFILCSLLLTAGLTFIQFGQLENRYLAIGILSVLTIPFFLWSLSEALTGVIWFMSWVLPLMFTLGMGLFYFLLPGTMLTAIPILLLYLFGLYALFLSENIFSVAAIRTIQLFRSASAVSFLVTLFTAFLLYDTVLSFRLPFYWNSLYVFVISFFLFIHGVWSTDLKEKMSRKVTLYTLLLSFTMTQVVFVLSFWPSTITLSSLFLTSFFYVLLGLTQAHLSDRLFERTVKEYLAVGTVVFIVLLLYTNWG